VEAISMERNRPIIHLDSCIRCFCCHELCPRQAIHVDWGIPGNWLMKSTKAPRQSFTRA
jgi:Fe-S-cluster-containing hydrogenase component 2